MPSSAVAFENQGVSVKVLVSSKDTRGEYTICEIHTDGLVVVPNHVHSYEDQWYRVLEGSYEFKLGSERVTASVGMSVAIPRETLCGISSLAAGQGRMLLVAQPGGLDLFFGEARAAQVGASGPEPLMRILDKHGIRLAG